MCEENRCAMVAVFLAFGRIMSTINLQSSFTADEPHEYERVVAFCATPLGALRESFGRGLRAGKLMTSVPQIIAFY